ncbi:MAG: histone deacetylase [Myxococcaceae bacterium]|nr:histone deacetylase [Myxococcaceae bacterium]
MDSRRANHALHYLLKEHAVRPEDVVQPQPVTYEALARVHTPDWLESLSRPSTLAHVFAVDEADIVVDELLSSVRLACGGTSEAASRALETKHPQLNLLGGFHHAAPSRGVGFCAVNDVAVAIASLRTGGFTGRVAVLDFDAHPPDGTAACLKGDGSVWLSSISGVSWGDLPGVDDVVLPKGTADAEYLAAVDAMLARMPPVDLAFVLAGGDVIAGDRLGTLGLSVAGARQRDLKIARHLRDVPSVWLPAGGYGPHAWKVLAGTGLALAFDTDLAIPVDFDPLGAELSDVAMKLAGDQLSGNLSLSEADFPELFGGAKKGNDRLLGFYTRDGLEYALERYGILPFVRRLGFSDLRVELEGPRMRLVSGSASLIELEVEKRTLDGREVLFTNWLSLRNPRAHFSEKRPKLPGQEVPGLGLAQEATALLAIMAERLKLDGVAFRPSWFHMAYAARHGGRFIEARRQGRFEALVRDLRALPLLEATRLVAEGRVRLNGEPYAWEADPMVRWLKPREDVDDDAVAAERDRCHFTVT